MNFAIVSHKLVVRVCPLIILAWGVPNQCAAHVWRVHESITRAAALSSPGLTNFLRDFLGGMYAPFTNSPPLDLSGLPGRAGKGSASPIRWMETGAKEEDGAASIRSSDHFCTVTQTRQPGPLQPGLTDGSELAGARYPGAVNSFKWTSTRGITEPSPSGIEYIYGWPNARDYEYTALYAASIGERQAYLAAMLCALGHIVHLRLPQWSGVHRADSWTVPRGYGWQLALRH